jgi:polyphosphate glucokinase
MQVLVIDVGGQHVKILASGQSAPRRMVSGRALSAAGMVEGVKKLTPDWPFDVVSLGYPGQVVHNMPAHEPFNLGRGWIGFDYAGAFGKPIKLINDAAMQALGSYSGGRMLFLGLGTGLGSAMVLEGDVEPLELAHLPYKKGLTYEDFVGQRGLRRLGRKKWRKEVADVVEMFRAALQPDYIVLGGGNARLLKELPINSRIGSNNNAFTGGFRLWDTASDDAGEKTDPSVAAEPSPPTHGGEGVAAGAD